MKERLENSIPDRTFSVWPFVSTAIYKNPLYQPGREKVLWPAHNVRDLSFWTEVYLGSFNNHQNREDSSNIDVEAPNEKSMTKTRSFDDLVKEMKSRETSQRRLSDPSINNLTEASLAIPLNIFQEDGEDFNEAILSDNLQDLVMENEKEAETEPPVMNGNEDGNDSVDSGSDGNEQLENTSGLIDASSDTIVPDEIKVDTRNETIPNGSITCQSKDEENEKENDEIDAITKPINPTTNGHCQHPPTNGHCFQPQSNGHVKIPLTKCHLQKLDTKKCELYQEENFKNGFCDTNGTLNCKKDAKESISSTTDSRMSTPGIQSTSHTPPTFFLDRTSTSITTNPDGLNHALNQENIRLQQIVYEHKLKEEALQRELHFMRLALLKNNSCQCNGNNKDKNSGCNQSDEMHPVIDCNSENSNCSWEAIDDRNPAFPVLWVPDHAITRCQGCQIEFWLGRRKHHCRSCGLIFCGDCSQFFAPFPKESFMEPVRLCGTCFQSVS